MEPSETQTLRSETPWGELALQLRGGPGGGAALILDGAFLMDSDAAESERRLARRGLEVWAMRSGRPSVEGVGRPPPTGCRVLVAGLGLGLTLRALLADPRVGRVEVVELLAPVVAWNRDALAGLNGRALEDPRVSVWVGDLRDVLEDPADPGRPAGEQGSRQSDARAPGAVRPGLYDLILLDIDNGPTWLSVPSNAWLYGPEGFARLRAALAPGGLAAYWATAVAPEFEALLAAQAEQAPPAEQEGERLGWWRESIVYASDRADGRPTAEAGGSSLPGAGVGRRWESYLYFIQWGRKGTYRKGT